MKKPKMTRRECVQALACMKRAVSDTFNDAIRAAHNDGDYEAVEVALQAAIKRIEEGIG